MLVQIAAKKKGRPSTTGGPLVAHLSEWSDTGGPVVAVTGDLPVINWLILGPPLFAAIERATPIALISFLVLYNFYKFLF